MSRTRRVLVVAALAMVAVLGSAGVAVAGDYENDHGGGDHKSHHSSEHHHKKHHSSSCREDCREDNECRGDCRRDECDSCEEDRRSDCDSCEEDRGVSCDEGCADPCTTGRDYRGPQGVRSLPGIGSFPGVRGDDDNDDCDG